MSWPNAVGPTYVIGGRDETLAEGVTPGERWHASLAVAEHATDPDDCRTLLAMLGLTEVARAPRAICGTRLGWERHRVAGEQACPACARALREYGRGRRG